MDGKYRTVMVLVLVTLLTGCAAFHQTAQRTDKRVQSQSELESGDLRIASSALQSGDVTLAMSIYSRLAQSNPDVVAVWMGLGDAHFLQGEFGAANNAYVKAQRLDPENIDAWLGSARILTRQRNLPEAIARYQSILTRFPDNPRALSGLGVSYDLAGDHGQAQSTYRRGLQRYPDDTALRNNLGLSLALDGKPREAINTLLGANGVSGKLPQERDNLALAYGMLGRDDAAEDILMSTQSQDRVQDNLAFYRYLRQNIGQAGAGRP
ncbi:tetratricopeptide repeat protein [Brenneria goodwinii]|uniref:tetratricopeptide repeat protein n=1 Tax=Brenneria goodwinii TaxID=1109412 RepID=UPI0036E6507A